MVITSDSAVPFRIAWPYLGRPGAQDQRERRLDAKVPQPHGRCP